MSTDSERLHTWADALESGEYRQIRDMLFGSAPGEACAIGVAQVALGLTHEEYALWSWPELNERIAIAIERMTGRHCLPTSRSISGLNDDGATFPEIAAGIRAVARQIEEGEYGAALPVAVETAVPA